MTGVQTCALPIFPDVRWAAILSFLLGVAATWAFSYGVPGFLQGPGARALNGVDLSWLAGVIVSGGTYYVTSARSAAGRRLDRGVANPA